MGRRLDACRFTLIGQAKLAQHQQTSCSVFALIVFCRLRVWCLSIDTKALNFEV